MAKKLNFSISYINKLTSSSDTQMSDVIHTLGSFPEDFVTFWSVHIKWILNDHEYIHNTPWICTNMHKYAQISFFISLTIDLLKKTYDVYVSPGNNRSKDFEIDDLISV